MTFLCRSLVLGLCVQDPVDVLSRVNDDYFTGSWSEFFEFICRLLHGSEDPGVIFEELKPRKESFGEIDIPAATRRSTSPSSCSYTSLSVMAGGNGHRPQGQITPDTVLQTPFGVTVQQTPWAPSLGR